MKVFLSEEKKHHYLSQANDFFQHCHIIILCNLISALITYSMLFV